MILAVLIFGWATQALGYEASRMKKPSQVMPFSYVAIIFSFWADVYLFDIKFGFYSIFGMILTSSGLLSKFLIEKMEKNSGNEK